jgi:hypothetical protein
MKAIPTFRVRRLALAAAASAFALAACDRNHNDGTDGNGGGAGVAEFNDLQGPTKVATVEMHEGTNMAATPSPDGGRIAFTAQGALWVVPVAGGTAARITPWTLEPTAPVWAPDGSVIAAGLAR